MKSDPATDAAWTEAGLRGLAAARIGGALLVLFSFLSRSAGTWLYSHPAAGALWNPYAQARGFVAQPDADAVGWLVLAGVAACLLLAAGWRTRIVGPVVFGLYSLMASLMSSWAHAGHGTHLFALFLFVFMFSPWEARWSLDARRSRRARRTSAAHGSKTGPAPLAPCTWSTPFVVYGIGISALYLSSALVKYRGGRFLESGNMEAFLAYHLYASPDRNAPAWGDALLDFSLQHRWLTDFYGWGTMLLEAGMVFLLLSRRTRILMFATWPIFHGFIAFLASLKFRAPIQLGTMLAVISLVVYVAATRQPQDTATVATPRSGVVDARGPLRFMAGTFSITVVTWIVAWYTVPWIGGNGLAALDAVRQTTGPLYGLIATPPATQAMFWIATTIALLVSGWLAIDIGRRALRPIPLPAYSAAASSAALSGRRVEAWLASAVRNPEDHDPATAPGDETKAVLDLLAAQPGLKGLGARLVAAAGQADGLQPLATAAVRRLGRTKTVTEEGPGPHGT